MGALNDESAYSSAPGVPPQNPSMPAQTSMPPMVARTGGVTQPVFQEMPSPPMYQPPQVEAPTYQPPAYPSMKPRDVPGPQLPDHKGEQGVLTEAISSQVFPGSWGGPGRMANPYAQEMKSATFVGGGMNGGGYQPPQWEGKRGRMAQYAQYVKKNPFRG